MLAFPFFLHINVSICHRGVKEENPSTFENELAFGEDMDEDHMFHDVDMADLVGEVNSRFLREHLFFTELNSPRLVTRAQKFSKPRRNGLGHLHQSLIELRTQLHSSKLILIITLTKL